MHLIPTGFWRKFGLANAKSALGGLAASALFIGGCGIVPQAVRLPGLNQPTAFELEVGDILATSVSFESVPGWMETDHLAAMSAFQATCSRFHRRDPQGPAGPPYAGINRDWSKVCSFLTRKTPAEGAKARALLERAFVPVRLIHSDSETGVMTSYFEPELDARRSNYGPFTEPLLGRPADLKTIDLPADRYGQTSRQEVVRQGEDGTLQLYDDRKTIRARADIPILGWARLEDVVFLQIQGSGRVRFEDETTHRVAFSATNGLPYESIATELVTRNELPRGRASNEAIRQWLANEKDRRLVESVVNANPRYVFFSLRPIGDPNEGPVGSANAPLTPQYSIAVDPNHHLMGGVYFLAPQGDGAPAPRLTVAQDTGGAIKGPLRSDLFFGTGDAAGEAAATIKYDARWWALIPRASAGRFARQS